ncbi:MAG TPA: hypothetical protein VLB09_05990, partial [Nitrospiria bacterium]|nr:hypothetical protein [Nitrospiria bacterium]
MVDGKGFFGMIKWKLITSTVVGIALFVVSGILGFPLIFQIMFAFYAVLGFLVFVLLDLPPMPEISGGKAIIGIL